MSRGKRYEEPKLNLKKVFAVILAIAVIIMFVFIIKGILDKGNEDVKITSQTYFVSFSSNKWGVIDSTGSDVISPSYQEMIIIPDNKKDVFLCTYDVDYNTGTYKTKALNSRNQEIFTNFEQIEAISNMDNNENLWYEQDVLKVKSNGKYGVIDLNGKEILPCEYEEIQAIQGIENALKVKKDGKYGLIDDDGKKLLDVKYTDITNLGKDNQKGYIVKNDQNLYGIVDYTGQEILPEQYQEIKKVYGNDYYVVVKDGKQVVIKKDGTEVLKDGFDEVKAILKNASNPGIIYKKDNKYGVMDTTGKVLINNEFEDIVESTEETFILKKDGKYGIMSLDHTQRRGYDYTNITYKEKAALYLAEDENLNTHVLDQSYTEKQVGILVDFDEEKGYYEMRQGDEYKYYNFKSEEKKVSDILTSNNLFISKKDGKYGFVDKQGNVVVDYQYDDATEQNSCGYAAIKKDGKWGAIDNKGSVIVEPTYTLDDYLLVDFIGSWHLGKDLNMNYYNKN